MNRNPYDDGIDLFRWRGASFDEEEDQENRRLTERLARVSANTILPSESTRSSGGFVVSRAEEISARLSERAGINPVEREELGFQRTFMDRAFSVFNAGQQFMFKLTQEVAEDGFQIRDIWSALSHGVDYFNPASDAKYIDADEIRQIFMGPSAEGVKRTFGEGAVNLALSIFYDPTWLIPFVGPAVKAAGLTGRAATQATNLLTRVANPGILALDAAKLGARTTGELGYAALASARGPERASEITNSIKRWVSDRHAGIDEGAREIIARMQYQISGHAREAGRYIKELNKLNPESQVLLARMIESDAVYNAKYVLGARTVGEGLQIGGELKKAGKGASTSLSDRQLKEIDSLLQEANRLGLQPDFLWESYDKIQKVTMGLTEDLLRLGIISPEEYAQHSGTYLRRLYTAAENPRATVARIDELVKRAEIGATPRDLEIRRYLDDMQIFDPVAFRRNIALVADDLSQTNTVMRIPVSAEFAATTRPLPGALVGPLPTGRDWFPVNPMTGRRTLDTDQFIEAIGEYSRQNPLASVDDLMGYISQTVFAGQRIPSQLTELVGNAITDSMTRQKGITSWRNVFANWQSESGTSFRQFGIQFDKISEREAIPEFIRREVLGEIESVFPRLAATAEVSGRQLEMARLFDTFAGAQAARLTDDVIEGVRKATYNNETKLPENVRKELVRLYGEDGLEAAIRGIIRNDPEYAANSVVKKARGSRWASLDGDEVHKSPINGEEFGSLNGMYVTPGLAAVLKNYQKLHQRAMGESPETALTKLGDAMATFTNFFKFSKIVLDPAANVRDTVSSILQVEITTGMPFRANQLTKSFKAATDFVAGRESMYHKAAGTIGYDLGGAGFFNSELQTMARSLAGLPQTVRTGTGTWYDNLVDMMTPVNNALTKVRDAASAQYQFRENVFRTYVFSSVYDDLAEKAARAGTDVLSTDFVRQAAKQAAAMTDRALFNYADVPLAVEFARKYGAAPFLTFPFKAAPQLFHVMYEAPYRVLKYERGVTQWNNNWAGGSEALAREIAALPDHKREAMVIRLPFEDKDNNPLYLDFSYFLPWYVINDISKDVANAFGGIQGPEDMLEDNRRRLAGDAGIRGGILTPVIGQIYEAVSNNRDGLGRPIFKETDTSEQKIFQLGRWLYQFMAPPTFPGGSTSDSVGRAMQAVASTSSEPVDWLGRLGLQMRTMGFVQDPQDAVNRYNERPTSRALAGGGANIQALGNAVTLGLIPPPDENSNENPTLQLMGGLASLFLNVTASDSRRSMRNERIERDMTNTEIQREIARVRVNRNMSPEERREEILRLTSLIRENNLLTRENILRMRP